jgi:ribosomal protein S18 acetylase RimI-like enzyme
MFLYSIDVFPDFQGRGVGTALIEKLKGMALARGCSEIFVLTNASNSAANRLYQKTGGIRENPDDVMYVYLLQQEPLLD